MNYNVILWRGPINLCASGQMVRNFRSSLQQLLESGDIDLCFANEDEAMELLRYPSVGYVLRLIC